MSEMTHFMQRRARTHGRAALAGSIAVTVAAAIAGLSGSSATAAASPLSRSLAQARARTHAPAATAAIYACGQLVWSGASGVKSLGSRRRVEAGTPFVLASVTKMVTATMILQLVQAGRLSLDQPLSDFYPGLPNAQTITVRELLSHTSGLAEYTDSSRFDRIAEDDPAHRWTRDEALALVGQPQFAPGAHYRYTNTNYLVLGGILEQLTGQSIEQDFQDQVATRVGMPGSSFAYAPSQSRRFAQPYVQQDTGARTNQLVAGIGITSDTWGEVWTDGGLASTAPDLAAFLDGLFAGKLIDPRTLAQMTTGADTYGLGIYAKSADSHRWFGHDGSYGGYESEAWHDPMRDITITVLTNLNEPDSAPDTTSNRIWDAIAATYDRIPPTPC